jgi:hypothetical protein
MDTNLPSSEMVKGCLYFYKIYVYISTILRKYMYMDVKGEQDKSPPDISPQTKEHKSYGHR